MKLQLSDRAPGTEPAALLALLCFEGSKPAIPPGLALPPAALKDFAGKFRQTLVVYPTGRSKVDRVAFVGLGKREKATAEELRRAAAVCLHAAKDKNAATLAIALPKELSKALDDDAVAAALAEGFLLGAYRYDKLKTPPKDASSKKKNPDRVVIHARGADFRLGLERGERAANAANFARALEDAPANYKTPTVLASEAKKLAGGRISCRVFEERDMKRLGFGALLGVAQGSVEPAKFIVLHYKPRRRSKECVALVGKGITFDSGGISIKPSASMDEMKYDMCGAGAVLGTFHALRDLDLPLEIYGLIPSTENLPSGSSYKPGDVVRAYDGTTIEVLNTDAEGRLILCDAIAYAEKTMKPDVIVDLATLTGAVVVALGHEMTGVFSNDETFQRAVCDAGNRAGERCWPMPMLDVHRDQMKGEVADLKNINSGKDGGGSIAGAAFLAHFVKKAKWVHMDIAGTAWGGRDRDYLRASGAAGVGVRTLIQLLHDRAARS